LTVGVNHYARGAKKDAAKKAAERKENKGAGTSRFAVVGAAKRKNKHRTVIRSVSKKIRAILALRRDSQRSSNQAKFVTQKGIKRRGEMRAPPWDKPKNKTEPSPIESQVQRTARKDEARRCPMK